MVYVFILQSIAQQLQCTFACVLQSETINYGAAAAAYSPLETMPDIALATESIGELNFQDIAPMPLEFELDLGDGAAHFSTGTMLM